MSVFERDKPLVGVVHLPPSLGYAHCPGIERACDLLRRDLAALEGMDGVLLENENDKPHTLTVDEGQLAWLTRLAQEARSAFAGPLGINVQRIDWRAALAVAAVVGLDFVRLDVFVDRVRMLDEVVTVDPEEVLAWRRRLGAGEVALLTDVHAKHTALVGPRSLAGSVQRAAESGSDVVLITGRRTSEPPTFADLDEAGAASTLPVWIGSGLTAAASARLAPRADGALVGTALKEGDRVEEQRVKEVAKAWRDASGSRR